MSIMTIVFGIKERDGRMVAEVIPEMTKATLPDATLRNVEVGSTLSTDELMSYIYSMMMATSTAW